MKIAPTRIRFGGGRVRFRSPGTPEFHANIEAMPLRLSVSSGRGGARQDAIAASMSLGRPAVRQRELLFGVFRAGLVWLNPSTSGWLRSMAVMRRCGPLPSAWQDHWPGAGASPLGGSDRRGADERTNADTDLCGPADIVAAFRR
jgi:hypothetical protein